MTRLSSLDRTGCRTGMILLVFLALTLAYEGGKRMGWW